MASAKTAVIEHLFFKYWDEKTGLLTKTVMSMEDVRDAIIHCNALPTRVRGLSADNLANFLKDVVRKPTASKNWPANVSALGFTGEQRTGEGNSFEFVPLPAGQLAPFLDDHRPTPLTPAERVQSVSLPRAAKRLGRTDEAWLIQTAVNLRIVEQYLATRSKIDVVEVTHLQMTVKLRATEIDAIYLANVMEDGEERIALVTCEAKKHDERILEPQIINQVKAAFQTADLTVDLVIPLAIRSIKGQGIHLVEFEMVRKPDLPTFSALRVAGDATFELVPPVKGI